MICIGPAAVDPGAGACEPALAEVPAGVRGCSCGARDGLPLRSRGRSLSSSPGGGGAEAEEAVGAGLEAAWGLACGAVCGGGVGAGDFVFSETERLNTGGTSRSSAGGFDGGLLFFAAAASMALADCQVPSPIHVSFACSAPVTVNNPCETPLRTAS